MQATSRALKLEDYDEIAFDPDVDGNRVRREGTWNVPNVNNRGLRADDDDGGVDSTTTVESSTMAVKLQDQETVESNFVTMTPPPLNQQTSHLNYFPYPPSRNPAAQHVTFTTSPLHSSYLQQPPHPSAASYFPPTPYLPPVNNYIDFYPSQLDYLHHPMPLCINPIHHKFTPVVHDTWSNHRKWK
jgi:hypothetical protein